MAGRGEGSPLHHARGGEGSPISRNEVPLAAGGGPKGTQAGGSGLQAPEKFWGFSKGKTKKLKIFRKVTSDVQFSWPKSSPKKYPQIG